MKIYTKGGIVTAEAETLEDVSYLLVQAKKPSYLSENVTKEKHKMISKKCGYCGKIFVCLYKHTPACPKREMHLEYARTHKLEKQQASLPYEEIN